MAVLGGWLSAASREERSVLRALTELSERKIPVRLEAENAGVSFFTIVSLRKNGVLIATPRSLRGGIAKGAYVRMTLPNRDRKQVRMPVVVPQVKLPMSMKYACICGVPSEFSGVSQRTSDRFPTTRFRNLHLQLRSTNKSYRVVDLSASGARIFTGTERGATAFEPGENLVPANLRVGSRATIELDLLIPRMVGRETVGLELNVARDGASERYLVNLLNRLQEQELRRLQIETA